MSLSFGLRSAAPVEPGSSNNWARVPLTPLQSAIGCLLVFALGVAALSVTRGTADILLLGASFVYLGHSGFFFTIWLAGSVQPRRHEVHRSAEDLPIYSVIVPLLHEASMATGIMIALSRLDYPSDRLDVLLAIEADDKETLGAVGRIQLPHWVKVCIVPEGFPRTKPRACNHALGFARGEFVVVFDAEDRPEPGQLREAIAAFDDYGPSVVCLQARLIPFNHDETFIARMFALDYCQWFDWVLPGLQRLRLPIPLGGTSNHFRRGALEAAGAWDPYNVTEDADLGVRLERLGHGTRTIASTTFEEAPLRIRAWIRQRTRWTKGYIQTFFVHIRPPSTLGLPPLSVASAIFLVVFVGGSVAFALLNPIFWTICILHIAGGSLDGVFSNGLSATLLALISLLVGNGLAIVRAVISPMRRDWHGLMPWGLLVWLYWGLLSWAAYRAVYGFIRRPFEWEKTTHGITRIAAGDVG